jgi:hypothetical protein
MLDKGQIKDWDGEPEGEDKPVAVTPVAPTPAARPDIGAILMASREAIPTGEHVTLTPAEVSARKKRNTWIALALGGFVILVFVLTMARVGGGAGLPEVYRIPSSSSQ